MTKYILSLIAIVFLMSSCEKAFIEPSAETTNAKEIFDEFWNLFNEKYAMFEFKGVNWQQEYDDNIGLISENTTSEELFELMGNMALKLRDGHTSLADMTRDTVKSFDVLNGAPLNFDAEMLNNQLTSTVIDEFRFIQDSSGLYTRLEGNIGYILLQTFNVDMTDLEIDTMLTNLQDTKGLIIDVRNNTGGSPELATRLATFFTNQEVVTGFERFKTGPEEADFSDSPAVSRAGTGLVYTKPVKVLTNGLCYSATTTFIYQTNPLDHVTFIGSRTGGGSGAVADGFLSNGWSYALSVSEFIDYEGRHLDDGFDPDIEVFLDESNVQVDEVIARAIEEINN